MEFSLRKKRRTPYSRQVKPRHVCEQDFSVKSCMQCTKLLPCTVCSTLWQFLSSLMCLDHMDWKAAAENSGKRHIMAHKIYVTHSVALTCSQGRGLISYIPRNHSRGYVGAMLDTMLLCLLTWSRSAPIHSSLGIKTICSSSSEWYHIFLWTMKKSAKEQHSCRTRTLFGIWVLMATMMPLKKTKPTTHMLLKETLLLW